MASMNIWTLSIFAMVILSEALGLSSPTSMYQFLIEFPERLKCSRVPDGPPLVIDLAVSVASRGKIVVAQNNKQPILEGLGPGRVW